MMGWLGLVFLLGVAVLGFVGKGSVTDGAHPTTLVERAHEDPIESLKQRYVNGEIDIEEFERRAKRLYETGEGTAQEQPATSVSGGDPRQTRKSSLESTGTAHPGRVNRGGRRGCRRG